MSRIGNGRSILRMYNTKSLKRVDKKSEMQDKQFGGRLSKGETFIIGDNNEGKERFYLTMYHDGSIEIWVRRMVRSSVMEETICTLSDYEVSVINQLFGDGVSESNMEVADGCSEV